MNKITFTKSGDGSTTDYILKYYEFMVFQKQKIKIFLDFKKAFEIEMMTIHRLKIQRKFDRILPQTVNWCGWNP